MSATISRIESGMGSSSEEEEELEEREWVAGARRKGVEGGAVDSRATGGGVEGMIDDQEAPVGR